MTREERAALRGLLAKATPRPWTHGRPIAGRPRFILADCVGWYVYPATNEMSHGTRAEDDAALIAAAVNALPQFLDAADAFDRYADQSDAHVKELEAERDRLREALARCCVCDHRHFAGCVPCAALRASAGPEREREMLILPNARGTTGGGDGGGA